MKEAFKKQAIVLDNQAFEEVVIDALKETMIFGGFSEFQDQAIADARILFKELLGDVIEIKNLVDYGKKVKEKLNPKNLKEANPLFLKIQTQFCYILRTNIALILSPQYIEDFSNKLKEYNIKKWNSRTFKDLSIDHIFTWFRKNIRNAKGDVDWELINLIINEEYGHKCTTNFRKPRTKEITIQSALREAQRKIEKVLKKKKTWHPSSDLPKYVYEKLRECPEFRTKANRPDIKNRRFTRPNWYRITIEIGTKYLQTLDYRENSYRDFEIATSELEELLEANHFPKWNVGKIHNLNFSLWNFFRRHKINAEDILKKASKKVKETYDNNLN